MLGFDGIFHENGNILVSVLLESIVLIDMLV